VHVVVVETIQAIATQMCFCDEVDIDDSVAADDACWLI